MVSKKRKRKVSAVDPVAARLAELERENERLTRKLQEAEKVIELQKQVAEILQIPLTRPEGESDQS